MQALYIPCTVHGHARDLASQVALNFRRKANTHAQNHAMALVFFTPFEIGSDTCSLSGIVDSFVQFRWRKE